MGDVLKQRRARGCTLLFDLISLMLGAHDQQPLVGLGLDLAIPSICMLLSGDRRADSQHNRNSRHALAMMPP